MKPVGLSGLFSLEMMSQCTCSDLKNTGFGSYIYDLFYAFVKLANFEQSKLYPLRLLIHHHFLNNDYLKKVIFFIKLSKQILKRFLSGF